MSVPSAYSQLLPSQAKGSAQAQIVMLSVNRGCAAGIIVGYDEKMVYIATAAHIAVLSAKSSPLVAVTFEGSPQSRAGRFLPQVEKPDAGDLAVVTVQRDESINKFLNELEFALLSPVPLGPANVPVTSIGCYGGAAWSSGTNETLLTPTPNQGYLQFQSDVGDGQSGGGLYNEAWELIGMPLDVAPNGVYARPISAILGDLRKWGVPVLLRPRPIEQRARGADEIARENATVAAAHQLVSASVLNEETDPELSVLIAAEAVAATWPLAHKVLPEAERQLHRSIRSSHNRLTLVGHNKDVSSVAWSPDGQRVATASLDHTAKVWTSDTGKELLTLSGHDDIVNSVAWSPDSRRLATGSSDHTAKIWASDTGKELLTLSHSDSVYSVAWGPDGRRLATSSRDHTVRVWDVDTGKESRISREQVGGATSVAWSPDGQHLAIGSGVGQVTVWDVEAGKQLVTLSASTGPGWVDQRVAWSPDGRWLATGGSDGARVWEANSGRELQVLIGHGCNVYSAEWSPDGRRLATGSCDHTARVWDVKSGKALLTLNGHGNWVNSVAWSPDGKHLVTGSRDATAKVWSTEGGKELLTLVSQRGEFTRGVAWSPDGRRLVTGTGVGITRIAASNVAKIWDAETGDELLTIGKPHDFGAVEVSFSPDGRHLATGNDSVTKVWDSTIGMELVMCIGGEGVWSPDGRRLATGTAANTASICDPQTGDELMSLPSQGLVHRLAWSPDGKRLLADLFEGPAEVWDLETGKELLIMRGHSPNVAGVAWSPDGKRVAMASFDKTAKVCDARSGLELLTLSGHTDNVSSIAWSPDGKRLATGSDDETTIIWSAESGNEIMALHGHPGWVLSVAWSPDGKRLATANSDGTVDVYAMDIHDLMALARQRVTAHPSDEGCKKYLHMDKCPPFPDLSY